VKFFFGLLGFTTTLLSGLLAGSKPWISALLLLVGFFLISFVSVVAQWPTMYKHMTEEDVYMAINRARNLSKEYEKN
jgi:hypothetical protein